MKNELILSQFLNKYQVRELTSEPDCMNLLTNSIKKMKNNILVEGSLKFRDKNFYYAIGHTDIKDMHINRNGDIDLLVTSKNRKISNK